MATNPMFENWSSPLMREGVPVAIEGVGLPEEHRELLGGRLREQQVCEIDIVRGRIRQVHEDGRGSSAPSRC